ncbi:MAG TPA: DMT family transporter [Thermoplasmataceae archaeon]|nr:DMT family transporter [Thermoplasmatales archaeon AK]HLH86643.1 DMT family transporter [Thermoplasmataceae archaeon]
MEKSTFYMGMLLLVTFFWGVTFPIVKEALLYIGPTPFLAFRFLAATAMTAIFLGRSKNIFSWNNVKHGFVAGALLFVGYFFQTLGLDYTTAAASGLITGIYVVVLPLVSYLYLRSSVSRLDWLASLISFGGLLVMTLGSLSSLGTLFGDILTVICGVGYAVQIAYVSKYSGGLDSGTFTFYQLAFLTILAFVFTPIVPGSFISFNSYVIFAAVFTALVGSVFAYYISTVALIYVEPTKAGIIFVGEPIFAAIASVTIGHETLGIYTVAGGAIMVLAMFITTAEKALRRKSEKQPAK